MPITNAEKATGAAARRTLAVRGWKLADLARRTGMKRTTVANILCGNNRSKKGRQKVEDALGVPLWSANSNDQTPQADE